MKNAQKAAHGSGVFSRLNVLGHFNYFISSVFSKLAVRAQHMLLFAISRFVICKITNSFIIYLVTDFGEATSS